MLLTRVLGLPQSIEIDQRPGKKFRRGFIGAPAAAGGRENKPQVPLPAHSLSGASLFLIWGEGRGVSRGRAGGMAQVFCPPLRWCCVQGACAVPCFCSRHRVFAPGSSKVAVGIFGLFVTFGSRICPNCACTQLFLVPYSFFVFCYSRRGVFR